jgi:uncharacterized protein (DUF2147 family)
MTRTVIALAIGFSALSATAQMTPAGLWKTISDKDGTPQSEVRIVDNGGVLIATLVKVYRPTFKGDEVCGECKDDRKDKPIIGLELMRGLKKTDGKDVWEGGTIVEPDSGTVYKAKVTPIEGGAKLEMRGFVGFALLGRTQTWIRIQ